MCIKPCVKVCIYNVCSGIEVINLFCVLGYIIGSRVVCNYGMCVPYTLICYNDVVKHFDWPQHFYVISATVARRSLINSSLL